MKSTLHELFEMLDGMDEETLTMIFNKLPTLDQFYIILICMFAECGALNSIWDNDE